MNRSYGNYRPTISDGDTQVPSVGSYKDYPAHQPFINTDYRRDPQQPIDSYPENNREAVMNALKSLQDRIRELEIERSQAEDNLRNIHHQTSNFRQAQHSQGDYHSKRSPNVSIKHPDVSTNVSIQDPEYGSRNRNSRHPEESEIYPDDTANYSSRSFQHPDNVTQQSSEIKSKLQSAEGRCNVLERQLECMRLMVQNAEKDRSEAVRKTAVLQQQQADVHEEDVRSHLQKLKKLEKEHGKLTATQNLAEEKIQELENRLQEEKIQRRLMQQRAAEVETAAATNRIMMETNSPRRPLSAKKTKKKKTTKNVASKKRKAWGEPQDHYRLNLGVIPFTAGQSTSPSHSIGANFQEVLSLMKKHNNKLCRTPREHSRNGYHLMKSKDKGITFSPRKISTGVYDSELEELLLQLQDEFGRLSFEHQELSKQIQQCVEPGLREDLERELDSVVAKMEAKGDQIGRLRRHQEQQSTKKLKKKSRPSSARASMPANGNGEIEVTTTIKTKQKGGTRSAGSSPYGVSRAQGSLTLLKDLRKIQTTLRKDDLCWE